jgi:hypothetical protein
MTLDAAPTQSTMTIELWYCSIAIVQRSGMRIRMSQASAGPESKASKRRRKRGVAGVIAQYIHELSERHREEARAGVAPLRAEQPG